MLIQYKIQWITQYNRNIVSRQEGLPVGRRVHREDRMAAMRHTATLRIVTVLRSSSVPHRWSTRITWSKRSSMRDAWLACRRRLRLGILSCPSDAASTGGAWSITGQSLSSCASAPASCQSKPLPEFIVRRVRCSVGSVSAGWHLPSDSLRSRSRDSSSCSNCRSSRRAL